MIDVMKLCTCDNPECENNPRRCADACGARAETHELSCTSCVATNLECNSLPRCFFHKLGFKSEEINTWTFEEFAMKVMESTLREKGLACGPGPSGCCCSRSPSQRKKTAGKHRLPGSFFAAISHRSNRNTGPFFGC